MRNEVNDPLVTLYEELNVIYNPNEEPMSKRCVFVKAFKDRLITYAEFKRIREHFKADDSWDH